MKKPIMMGDEEITKAELIRRTVALHPGFRPCDIEMHIKQEYGVNCSSGNISTVRNNYLRSKPRPQKNGKPMAPVHAGDDIVDAEFTITAPPSIEGIRALKEAVRLLGKDACREIMEIAQ